jgi:hypothetical protein
MSIVTYNFTAQEREDFINGREVDLSDKVESVSINDEGLMTDIFSKDIIETCLVVISESCSCNAHNATTGYDGCLGRCYNYSENTLACTDNSGGNGSPDNTDSTNPTNPSETTTSGVTLHPSGSGGGATTPTLCETCEEFQGIEHNPCEQLKKLTNKNSQRNSLIDLKNHTDAMKEHGSAIKAIVFGENVIVNDVTGNGQGSQIPIPSNSSVYGINHTHMQKDYNMFGHGDIHSLYLLSQQYQEVLGTPNTIDLFVITMVIDNYIYAIKIDDPNALASIADHFFTKKKKNTFIDQLQDVYDDVHPDAEIASQTGLEVAFLKFVNETFNFGISLYRTNDDFSTFPQDKIWDKLTLGLNDTVIPTPCN